MTYNSIREQTAPQLEQEVFARLQQTTEMLVQDVAALLKPAGLSFSQYNVLRILRGAGSNGLLCQEIAGRMVTRDPDMTRLLDRMEKNGLVSRARDRADRRMVTVRIKWKGLKVLLEFDEPMLNLHRQQFAHVDEEQLSRLLDMLAGIHPKR